MVPTSLVSEMPGEVWAADYLFIGELGEGHRYILILMDKYYKAVTFYLKQLSKKRTNRTAKRLACQDR